MLDRRRIDRPIVFRCERKTSERREVQVERRLLVQVERVHAFQCEAHQFGNQERVEREIRSPALLRGKSLVDQPHIRARRGERRRSRVGALSRNRTRIVDERVPVGRREPPSQYSRSVARRSSKPLASNAGATSVGAMSFRNRPIPPRTFPNGAPNPGIPVVPFVPNARKNPMRGLMSMTRGTKSVRCMKAGVDVGIVRRPVAEAIGVNAHTVENLRARSGPPIVAERQRSGQRIRRRALAHEHSAKARRRCSRRRRRSS